MRSRGLPGPLPLLAHFLKNRLPDFRFDSVAGTVSGHGCPETLCPANVHWLQNVREVRWKLDHAHLMSSGDPPGAFEPRGESAAE
jgi:hypothetical protein